MDNLLTELSNIGIVVPDDQLTDKQISDIFEYIAPQKLWLGGHWTAYARESELSTSEFMTNPDYSHALGCYSKSVAALCPHLADKAMKYSGLAKRYLGSEASLFNMNIFWSFPGGLFKPEIQDWHRDICTFDDKHMALFFYLTDIGPSEAHGYIRGSHISNEPPRVEAATYITGPAGTMFIENSYGFHKGGKPISRCRLLSIARYGISV